MANLGIHLGFQGQRVLHLLFCTLLINYITYLIVSIFAMIITIIIVVVGGGADQGRGGRVSSLELKTFGRWSVSRP